MSKINPGPRNAPPNSVGVPWRISWRPIIILAGAVVGALWGLLSCREADLQLMVETSASLIIPVVALAGAGGLATAFIQGYANSSACIRKSRFSSTCFLYPVKYVCVSLLLVGILWLVFFALLSVTDGWEGGLSQGAVGATIGAAVAGVADSLTLVLLQLTERLEPGT